MLELEGHCQKCEEGRRGSCASGCPPHPLALSVDILFLRNKSQRTHTQFVEEQDSEGCCVPVPNHCFKSIPLKWHMAGQLSLGQTGLAPAPWGAWRGEVQCKSHRRSFLPFPGQSPAWALWLSQLACHLSPTMSLKSGVKADN